jgi:hypothetical protein
MSFPVITVSLWGTDQDTLAYSQIIVNPVAHLAMWNSSHMDFKVIVRCRQGSQRIAPDHRRIIGMLNMYVLTGLIIERLETVQADTHRMLIQIFF